MSLTIYACYVAAEIPNADFNKETFEEVKKILLLELKASGGDFLLIENEPYTKQDLLDYFENVQQEFFKESTKEVTEIPLLSDNAISWHSPLNDPISIMHVFEVPNELMDLAKQEEAKVLVEKLYGPKIIQVCLQQFKDKNFDQLQFLLSYEFVFSLNLAHEIKRNLSILFNNLCLSIRKEIDENPNLKDVENSLFLQSSFYSVLFFLKDTNEGLTRSIMNLGVERMKGDKVTNKHKLSLFNKFTLLPHDQLTIDYVNKWIQYYEERIEEKNKNNFEQRENLILINAFYIIVVTVKELKDIFISILKLSKKLFKPVLFLVSSAVVIGLATFAYSEYLNAKNQKKVIDTTYYLHQQFVISDYSKLAANIDSNVTNLKVAAFLKNSLHKFCYFVNKNDTLSLSFDPLVRQPGSVHIEFQNTSEFSTVLFLVYDEQNPQAKVKAKFIEKCNENKLSVDNLYIFDVYMLPSERAIIIIDPNLIDSKTLGPTTISNISSFNMLFDSYKLKNRKLKEEDYLRFYDLCFYNYKPTGYHEYDISGVTETFNRKNLLQTP